MVNDAGAARTLTDPRYNRRVIFVLRLCLMIALATAPAATQTAPPAFQNPPASFRPIAIWNWSGAPEAEELRAQVRDFKERGFGGVLVHARLGLAIRYLGDDWFQRIGVAVDEARKAGIELWVYDDDRASQSGHAGGLVTRERPELAAMTLEAREIAGDRLAQAIRDPETLAVFDVSETAVRRVASTSEQPQGRLVQFVARPAEKPNRLNGEPYPDLLNPEAAALFLKLTLGDGYGTRGVPAGIMTAGARPPALGADGQPSLPWSRGFPALFRGHHEYDLLDKLPLLSFSLPGFEQVRYDFWRTIAEQLESAFGRPYAEAAARAGLRLAGGPQTASSMLQYAHGLPIIEPVDLGRGMAQALAMRAASAANQLGRERVMGVVAPPTAEGMPATLKAAADLQLVLGANLLAARDATYTLAGESKRLPARLGYQQPWWPHARPLADYLGRAAWFAAQGKPHHKILLLEPLGSIWAHSTPSGRRSESVELVERRFLDTFETLLALHRGFDLGDELLVERHARAEKGELRIGPDARYTVVVVPPAFRWNDATVRLLDEFLGGGGKAIFHSPQPASVQNLLMYRDAADVGPQPEDLAAALGKFENREVSIADADGREIPELLLRHRFDGMRHYFFVTNTSRDKTHRPKITLDLAGILEEWDLQTGEVRRLRSLDRELLPGGSFAFALDISGTSEPMRMPERIAEPQLESIAGPFKFRRLQPNTLALDRCRYTINGGAELGPAPLAEARRAVLAAAGLDTYSGMQPWAMEAKGIRPKQDIRFTLRFEFDSELEQPRAWLAAERLASYEVRVNGNAPGAPDGWHLDKQFLRAPISGRIRRGTNTIQISASYAPGLPIEPVYIAGDFATSKVAEGRYTLVAEPTELRAGSWASQGYEFYAGNIAYRLPVDYKAAERVMLRVKDGATAGMVVTANRSETLRVAGRDVAPALWPPYEVDVTAALRPGPNVIELTVLGTLPPNRGGIGGFELLRSRGGRRSAARQAR